jgi:glycosyltransferase involved in cell wall biosynthesis
MNLVIFTNHYPYGKGEEFLEPEIKTAECFFDNITIVTLEKKLDMITKYVPRKANIIRARGNINRYNRMLSLAAAFFKPSVWKEIVFSFKHFPEYGLMTIIKRVFTEESAISYIFSSEKLWLSNSEETIYYSYWLETSASYLSRYRNRFNGICISRAHGGDCFYDRGYHPFRIEQLKNLDYIFPISDIGRNDLLSHNPGFIGGLEEKIRVSRLGIITESTVPEFNYSKNGTFTIVSCSSIIMLKRLDLLIDALASTDNINIRWIHFGDGELGEQIKKMAESKLKPKSNISYDFRGNVANSEILEFYKNNLVDLFVNCSDVEGISVAAMEAMSYGIPAISRDVGGMSELVNNKCGCLLKKNISGGELGGAIVGILQIEESERLNKRKNAYEIIHHNYSAEVNFIEFYKYLLNRYKK